MTTTMVISSTSVQLPRYTLFTASELRQEITNFTHRMFVAARESHSNAELAAIDAGPSHGFIQISPIQKARSTHVEFRALCIHSILAHNFFFSSPVRVRCTAR